MRKTRWSTPASTVMPIASWVTTAARRAPCASRDRDDHRLVGGKRVAQRARLVAAERWLAVGREDLSDGAAGTRLHLLVGVEVTASQPFGERTPDRGLARSHHPDQR